MIFFLLLLLLSSSFLSLVLPTPPPLSLLSPLSFGDYSLRHILFVFSDEVFVLFTIWQKFYFVFHVDCWIHVLCAFASCACGVACVCAMDLFIQDDTKCSWKKMKPNNRHRAVVVAVAVNKIWLFNEHASARDDDRETSSFTLSFINGEQRGFDVSICLSILEHWIVSEQNVNTHEQWPVGTHCWMDQ